MKKGIACIAVMICLLANLSCGHQTDESDPLHRTVVDTVMLRWNTTRGVIGVYQVPELITFSILDSAASIDMAAKLAKDYALLEEDAAATGAELVDAPGIINYNNNPFNFKFECLLPVKALPAKDPQHCKVVALEAAKMVVYNHYGSYAKLLSAYDSIRVYCKHQHLTQSGPMREFYISDPDKEPDSTKWLTRVMLPVE